MIRKAPSGYAGDKTKAIRAAKIAGTLCGKLKLSDQVYVLTVFESARTKAFERQAQGKP